MCAAPAPPPVRKRAIAWPTILCAGPGCLLNTNEVRARAAEFARDWKDARYERGEAQSFYNDFFNVFGMKRRQYPVLLTNTAQLA